MVQVTHGQSQLSGWGHYAEPTALFINKTPDPLMVGDIIDISATLEPGGTELHFSDGTVLSYRQSSNLLPALNNVTVWSVPAAGTTVPNDLDYVEIHASYVTKHGKTINAIPAKIPIVRPVGIRIVTAADYIPKEAYFNSGSVLFDASLMPLDTSKYKTYALYAATNGNDVIFTEEIVPSYTTETVDRYGGGYGHVYGIFGRHNRKEDITVYHSVDEPSTETFDYAFSITATATIKGLTFTDTTYLDSVPINYFDYNFPTVYGEYTLTKGGIIFKYLDGASAVPTQGLSDMWLWFSTAAPNGINVYESKTINLYEGNEGDIWLSRDNPRVAYGEPSYEASQYHFVCSGGTTNWTRVE